MAVTAAALDADGYREGTVVFEGLAETAVPEFAGIVVVRTRQIAPTLVSDPIIAIRRDDSIEARRIGSPETNVRELIPEFRTHVDLPAANRKEFATESTPRSNSDEVILRELTAGSPD